jgi:beta-phosphoglucomutase
MSKRTLKTKAVIFDMDGVITNTMPDHCRAWQAALKEEGIHATREDVYSREGQRGLTSVREMFEERGRVYCQKSARRILAKKEKIFKKITRNRFISGSRTFIKQLFKGGFGLAIVTGTSRHEMERILPESLYRCFQVSVTGCEVKEGKPDPEPYLTAIKRMDIVKKDAVVIENAPFGIRSAKAAGLYVLALETSLTRKHLKEADGVFASIGELCRKVRFERV